MASTPLAPSSDRTPDLALAVVAASATPLLLLDGDLTILAASRSFGRAFRSDPSEALGRRIADLGAGEWNVPQLIGLLLATASGAAEIVGYEMTLSRKDQPPRRLVVDAQRIGDRSGGGTVRVLLSLVDVTDARASEAQKDTLLREKAILLEELQHRVANSLQIIASVLMQSARRVQSDETRTHLYDAHNRVMSVAALQKQLSTSQIGDVPLRPYLTDLCRSIDASMIRGRDSLRLDVAVDDCKVTPANSISLGLVVTELVINALKHGFPGQRGGQILVSYHAEGDDWTLSVADDGVGMPAADDNAKAGLGTSIVKALAAQLGARIEVAGGHPGTLVALRRGPVRGADGTLRDTPEILPV